MTIESQKACRSLRSRFIAGISIMLLPMAILMASAFYSIQNTVDSIEHIVTDPVEELIFTKNIENLILKTEIPLYQYLYRGETGDREAFIRVGADIDVSFENVFSSQQFDEKEKKILSAAQTEWQTARRIGESLLSGENIPESDILIKRTDEFGRHLGRSISFLEDMSLIALSEIRDQRLAAQKIEWQSIGVITIIFIIGLIVAIIAAISLTHSVIDPIRQLEHTIQRFRKGDLSSRAHHMANDELGHLASAFNAMAERFQKVQKELDYLSIHDGLTGLYDHGKFHELVILELQRTKRYKRSFSLLLIDISNFRRVNETYGNLVGDSVLASVAAKISSNIRPTDVAARHGGDEFAIILSETDQQGAYETADRIATTIADNALNIGDGKTLDMRVSIGIATYPHDADNETALFAFADQSLHEAKHINTTINYSAVEGQN